MTLGVGRWLAAAGVVAGCARAPLPGGDAREPQAGRTAVDVTIEVASAAPDDAAQVETAVAAQTDGTATARTADSAADGAQALADAATPSATDAAGEAASLADVVGAGDGLANCPSAAPPDATASDLGAPPAPCATPEPPPWWPVGTAPPPTLTVLIGRQVPGQGWQALGAGQWAPLQQGGQGGGLFHLALAPKVLLPGTTAPVADLQVQLLVLQGCGLVASADKAKFAFVQATDPEDWYVPDPTKALVAVFAQTGEPSKLQACAAWLQVVARVRALPGGPWGQAQVAVRAYDDTAAPVGPKP